MYQTIAVTPAQSHLLPQVRDFLAESEDIYPGIDRWWNRRVVPGLATGERKCLVVLAGHEIAALSISKFSASSAKFCTLRVRPEYQRQGIGQDLIRRTLLSFVQANCRQVHFTMNEGIAGMCIDFFKPYGFGLESWLPGFYSRGEDEMCFSAPINRIRTALRTRSRSSSDQRILLMSVKPQYAALIESGTKTVEFRRRFSNSFDSGRAFIYITAPASELRLTAHVSSVTKGPPHLLWERYQHLAGDTLDAFRQYFADLSSGFAILLDKVHRLAHPVSLDAVRRSGYFSPPQSYQLLPSTHPIAHLMPM